MGISVIISAYNRKEYIKNAIDSVALQEHNGFDVEIIVITNFKDENVAIQCSKVGARYCVLQDGGMGLYLHYGITLAKYDIISFLDDDDLFCPGKLKEIYTIFSANPDVGYLHNRFKSADLPESNISSYLYLNGKNPMADRIRIMMTKGNWENLSSVSIRKTKYIEYIRTLPRLVTIPDLFFVMVTIDSNITAVISDRQLTKYLFHESESHILRGENLYSRKDELLRKYTSSMKVIMEVLRNKETLNYMQASLAHNIILKNCIGYDYEKVSVLKLVSYAFRGIKYTGSKGLVDILQAIFYVVFPSYMRNRTMAYISRTAKIDSS